MAKRKTQSPIKRITAKNGQIYYFKNGKRLSEKKGASEFVKTFFSQIDPKKLSPKELQSFKGKQATSSRLRFKGRFVPKYLQTFLVEQKLINPNETEIRREFTEARDFGDFLRDIKSFVPKTVFLPQTEWGLPNSKRERATFESVIDIVENIQSDPLFSSLDLMVIDTDGTAWIDKMKALDAIRDWEIDQIDEILKDGGNPAYTKFAHYGKIDIENGVLTINLNESDADTQYS
jgi:hypothetical protein